MDTKIVIGVVALVVAIGAWFWWPTVEHPVVATAPTATSTQQVPGNNLALGEQGSATLGMYLIAYNGMTLYTFAKDAVGTTTCYGVCATKWPPYIVSTTSSLVAEYPIAGKVGTLERAGGALQLTYRGVPLYFYSGDAASGETNGAKISKWALARP